MGHAAELVARLGLAVCWGLASGRGVEITLDALTGGMYLVNRPIAVAAALMIVAAIPPLTATQHSAAPDSQAVLRAVQSAQVRFERTRRRYMRWGDPTYGSCEIRIGRYCLSNLDWGADETWTEPVEDPAVGVSRLSLIARLDSAAAVLPGDPWIAGQRVRYLVEADDPSAALTAATECRSVDAWWCLALAGFAHYAANDFSKSDSAYTRALEQMDEALRCEWSDLTELLSGDIRKRYRKLSCAERDSLQRRIFWLADPFYSIPGNELRAEHYSRQVHSAFLKVAESPEGDRWGRDLHRFVMRYGWTFGWERIRTTTQALKPPVRGHFGHGAKYFLPVAELVDRPFELDDTRWDLEPNRPRAGHAPPYAAAAFDELSHQLFGFLRGDSLVVVAVFELTDDSVPHDASVSAAMVLQRGETAQPLIVQRTVIGKSGSLTMVAPLAPPPHLLSLEVLATKEKRAARARYGLQPTQLITTPIRRTAQDGSEPVMEPAGITERALSGWLLTTVDDSLPETLEAAIESARPTSGMHPGERFGLYWELYGTGAASERISTSITLAKRGKSLWRRVADVFGLGSDKPPLSLRWQDRTASNQPFYPRSVAVDLPEKLPPGTYVLTLEVEFTDGAMIRIEKPLDVSNRP